MNAPTKNEKRKASPAAKTIPPGYRTVTPWIIVRGAAELIEFLGEAFGAVEQSRLAQGDGTIVHAEVRIGDSIVMLFDAKPEWPDTPSFLRLYVDDADLAFERALLAGATAVTDVAEHSFGDRVGRVRDPKGNLWWIQSHVHDATPEEMAEPSDEHARAMQDAMKSLDDELKGRAH
jgi:PhnB protein